jgi:GNAT superfamily N-acetyltransferase
VLIRPLIPADLPTLAAAFAAVGWPGKQPQLFQRYIVEQHRGARVVLVAEPDGVFAGHACILWRSGYQPFRQAGIPEIADVNVLPAHRRRGVGTALMDAAETVVAQRSPIVGLGCGLYADYGPALLLYLRRGYLPDGRGIAYGGRTVVVGDSIRLDDSATLMFTKPVG